jgi:hypothetical protein
MKKSLFTLAAIITVALFSVSTASAQCDFNAPGKAKGLKSDMVRGYVPCGSGITYASPNTAGATGTPGCAPPVTYSAFLFGPKGKCSVKSTQKLEDPCKTGTPGACTNITLKAKCSGITEPDTITPILGPGWALNTLARATLNDSAGGDQTIIDFPAQFTFGDAKKGKIGLTSDTHTLLELLFGPGNELAACTSLETVFVRIVDPAGRLFAVQGSSSRP